MEDNWISVKERLPEIDQVVLCYGAGERSSMAQYTGVFERYIDTIESDRVHRIYYDLITHWMPLPNPPKV